MSYPYILINGQPETETQATGPISPGRSFVAPKTSSLSRRLVPMPHEDGYLRSHTGRGQHFHSLICDTGTSTRPTEASSVRPRSREFSGRKHGKINGDAYRSDNGNFSLLSGEEHEEIDTLPPPSITSSTIVVWDVTGKALSSYDMLMVMLDWNYDCTLVH